MMKGGYGLPYDPNPDLDRLERSEDGALEELWANLYHQGDVGLASYAAVPRLVDLRQLSLVAAIEVARHADRNPDLPEELSTTYHESLSKALDQVPSSAAELQGYYAIHACVSGQVQLAKALDLMDVDSILDEYGT